MYGMMSRLINPQTRLQGLRVFNNYRNALVKRVPKLNVNEIFCDQISDFYKGLLNSKIAFEKRTKIGFENISEQKNNNEVCSNHSETLSITVKIGNKVKTEYEILNSIKVQAQLSKQLSCKNVINAEVLSFATALKDIYLNFMLDGEVGSSIKLYKFNDILEKFRKHDHGLEGLVDEFFDEFLCA